ncbi:hypothetical protein MMP61_10090 [Acinetobacter sp. NIPH 1958]|uniref:hypothetical protein n=1 Tax=Acinetobacter sp. NIPH 1958 TaxID=2923430 RepID=UPI001F4AFB8F|nr:hypothetical protein [Acinetobacter sp. NIPH 1958]MCH7355911.1 hypothetical protein [Acinetobacter sp. NIPH 1958]
MYDDEQEPNVQLPEKLVFINTITGEQIEVHKDDFGIINSSSTSITFSGDVTGHGTTEFEVYADQDFPINPPADAYVIRSESGNIQLHESTVEEISIELAEDNYLYNDEEDD